MKENYRPQITKISQIMNAINKPEKALFILGAIILFIASFLKINNIGIADYILALGILLMASGSIILFAKYRNIE